MFPPARSSLPAPDHLLPPGDEPDSIDELSDFRPPRHLGRPTLDAALGLVRAAPVQLLAALAVPMLPVVALGSLLFTLVVPSRFAWTDGPIVFTSGPATAPLTVFELVALGVLATAVPLAAGIGLSAALLVALGSCLYSPVDARTALREVFRRPRVTAIVSLAIVVFLAAPAVGMVVAMHTSVLLASVVALTFLWISILLSHGAARMIAGLPEKAWSSTPKWRWWPIPRGCAWKYTFRPMIVMGAVLVLCVLVVHAVSFLPGPAPLRWAVLLFLLGAVCAAGGAWLASLLVVGSLQYRDGPAESKWMSKAWAARLRRQHQEMHLLRTTLPDGGGPRSRRASTQDMALVMAGAVLAVLVLPASLWARPGEPVALTVEYTGLPSHMTKGVPPDLVTFDGGLRASASGLELWCDPDCSVAFNGNAEDDPWNPIEPGTHVHTRGGSARAAWEWETPGFPKVGEETTLTLGTDCDAQGCHAPEQVLRTEETRGDRKDNPIKFLVAVAEHENGFHVITAVHEQDEAELTIEAHACADQCSDPVTLGVAPGMGQVDSIPDRLLDSATGPEGEPVATLYDRATGSVSLFRCSDVVCTDTHMTEVVPATVVASHMSAPASWSTTYTGARVEVRPDGTPVIAYRAARDGSARLLDCVDTNCGEFEERVLSDPGWEQHLPGLTLDGEGRPLSTLADGASDTVALVACSDTGCSEWESRILHDARAVIGASEVVVDARDRPVVAANLRPAQVSFQDERAPTVLALHRCGEPGCGLSR